MKHDVQSLQPLADLIVEGFFHATNQGDFSFIPKIYTPHALIHTFEGGKKGPEVIIDIFKRWQAAFPDLQIEPLLITQESDVLVAHWRAKGTFIKPLREIPPAGKRITMHGITCFRCDRDQVIEHWATIDYRPLSQ